MSNELEILRAQVATLQKRVKLLEQNVRPLVTLSGIDANLISDQAVVSFCAESAGSTLNIVAGPSRTREASDARRSTARLLKEKLGWSNGRIGRNLARTERGVNHLLAGK